MATTIEGVAVVAGGRWPRRGALHLATSAVREVLRRSAIGAGDVDLLINCGLYRDRNLGEPALAPLIQEDVGANPGDPRPGGRGTFSFDVGDGACGVLVGLQIADGFLRSGAIDTAVVAASDANPGRGLAEHFPYRPAGGALVCRRSAADAGLGPFSWVNDEDGGESFRATVTLVNGRNVLTVTESPAWAGRAGAAAAAAAAKVLAAASVTLRQLDLVVAAPCRAEFTEVLGDRLALPRDRIVTAGEQMHTAAFVAALGQAVSSGQLAAARTVLLVCGGSGITAGAAIYRP